MCALIYLAVFSFKKHIKKTLLQTEIGGPIDLGEKNNRRKNNKKLKI